MRRVVLFIGSAIFAAAAAILIFKPNVTPLPVFATLADFTLTDQADAPFPAEKLRGHVWIANFIFTRCPTICPLFTEKMARLTGKTNSAVRFVSFSVDPEYDTPTVLAAYAKDHHANWTFLTGPIDEIKRTVVDGMKISVERNPNATDPGSSIFHGTHFVLVDAALRVRGYYGSSDEAEIARLIEDSDRLVSEMSETK